MDSQTENIIGFSKTSCVVVVRFLSVPPSVSHFMKNNGYWCKKNKITLLTYSGVEFFFANLGALIDVN